MRMGGDELLNGGSPQETIEEEGMGWWCDIASRVVGSRQRGSPR